MYTITGLLSMFCYKMDIHVKYTCDMYMYTSSLNFICVCSWYTRACIQIFSFLQCVYWMFPFTVYVYVYCIIYFSLPYLVSFSLLPLSFPFSLSLSVSPLPLSPLLFLPSVSVTIWIIRWEYFTWLDYCISNNHR